MNTMDHLVFVSLAYIVNTLIYLIMIRNLV